MLNVFADISSAGRVMSLLCISGLPKADHHKASMVVVSGLSLVQQFTNVSNQNKNVRDNASSLNNTH